MLQFLTMIEKITHTATIPESMTGKRLDQAIAKIFPQYSRTRLQQWLKSGELLINQQRMKGKEKIAGGEQIEINAQLQPQQNWSAQNIPLTVIYEDQDLIIVNKPAGLVVHPAAGNLDGTLVNALLNYDPELKVLPRCGLIHRLDKDTTGLLVVARNLISHNKLVAALQAREIKREYEALVHGVMTGGGTVNAPIARHPKNRLKMAVVKSGKPAATHYQVIQRYNHHTHLKLKLETGRTHQIRVHMAHIHYPVVGDKLYGKPNSIPSFPRQALHAICLGLVHPTSGEKLEWRAEVPIDFQTLLAQLK